MSDQARGLGTPMFVVEHAINQNLDARVTFFGPLETFTTKVAGDFDWDEGNVVAPSQRAINDAIDMLAHVSNCNARGIYA